MGWESIILVPVGFAAGILAGYLGIGGGAIFVPVLFFGMATGCPAELLPKLCVGTSIGAVLPTAASGTLRHWKLSNVSAATWIKLSVGALPGSFFGGWIVSKLPCDYLRAAIGIVLLIAAIKMAMRSRSTGYIGAEKSPWWLPAAGFGIGLIASTVGIGGGILAVPLLAGLLGFRTERAAGTSASMTLLLAAGALIGHIVWGNSIPGRPEGCVGFVYLPKSLALGIPAAVGAWIGAGFHERFNPGMFKIVFSIVLVLMAFKILFF